MRDLEIRGAGELLGTRQHGHIHSVGFHLYTQMLSSAVKVERKLRGLPDDSRDNLFVIKELSLPVAVDLPLAVELPTEYIADQNTRLKLYRRMADVSSRISWMPWRKKCRTALARSRRKWRTCSTNCGSNC